MAPFYWERHPDGPFATLIEIATNYLDPENYDPEALKSPREAEGDRGDAGIQVGTREAIKDPGQLPGDELFESVEYSEGSDEAFLRRLWHDLYGDETP